MNKVNSPPKILVVTDLDGTLLDEKTYEFTAAGEALALLRKRAIPLVLATSKTRSEVEPLAATLGLPSAWIVENGGEVIVPREFSVNFGTVTDTGTKPLTFQLGIARALLVTHLAEIAARTGTKLKGFSKISLEELALMTGLAPAAARLAADREYDEPFLVEDNAAVPAIVEAAREQGLVVTRGGRFWHLSGPLDKGKALRVLLDWFAERGLLPVTIGLGDSPNDISFLRVVDHPILVPRPDGKVDQELAGLFATAESAPYPGPEGWNIAVITALQQEE